MLTLLDTTFASSDHYCMLFIFVLMFLLGSNTTGFVLRHASHLSSSMKIQPRRICIRAFARKSAAARSEDAAREASKISHTSLAARAMKRTKDTTKSLASSNESIDQAEDELNSLLQQVLASANLVSVTDSQRTIPIDTEQVTKQAKIIMEILNVKDFELDIQFCSEAKIRSLNKDWREKAASTDILSFPTNEFDAPEIFDKESKKNFAFQKHLGDLVIAPVYVQRRCDEDKESYKESMLTAQGRAAYQETLESDAGVNRRMSEVFTLEERTPLLMIHGILHLLGYDHETDADWAAMTAREAEVMEKYYDAVKKAA